MLETNLRAVCVDVLLRSLQWCDCLSCVDSNSFEFSKFSFFSLSLFSQADLVWEGTASISGQRSLNPKSIDCLHKIPFGHSNTDQIFRFFFFFLWLCDHLFNTVHPKTTDHQIYILWHLFYLDKTLWVCFFPLLFTGHPCLKAFPSCVCVCVCVSDSTGIQ